MNVFFSSAAIAAGSPALTGGLVRFCRASPEFIAERTRWGTASGVLLSGTDDLKHFQHITFSLIGTDSNCREPADVYLSPDFQASRHGFAEPLLQALRCNDGFHLRERAKGTLW
jgi:hypothetical protein